MSALREDGPAPLAQVAIVGMAGRFPRCRTLNELWRNLRDGVECISSFSEEELLAAGVDRTTLADPAYVRAGAPLEDLDLFDAPFFRFSPREAEITDPQHRVFLECAWEALESAGYDPERYPGAIGVFAGSAMSRYLPQLYADPEVARSVGSYRLHLGNDKDFLPTLASYKLNLRGPSVCIQTACSTSLVAVHLAVQSLLNGECDMALAGGVSITVLRKSGYFYREGGISSPDGHCRAFDAAARGTVGGNGAGVVVLKRLTDALADGDPIRAVILGSAVNNDGLLKVGFTAPGLEGQARVIREALTVAGVDPETITYVEAHGTGTGLGDPVEIAALTQAFRAAGTDARGFCAIGSVKTNLGHLDVAAGMAGLIKTVLALERATLPPSLHFTRPNPEIDFANSPFYVNAELAPWRANGAPRRAGVSAFGIGGTNAHLTLEEAPPRRATDPAPPWHLLLLSAETEPALERATAELAEHLRSHPELELADVAFTLQVGRRHCRHRRALVCRDREEALAALADPRGRRARSCEGRRAVAFLLPGQGSQYPGMTEEVYRREPRFRAELDRCAGLLMPRLGVDLRDLLYPDAQRTSEAERALQRTALAQPALFATEYALAVLWQAWGVRPGALLGHSLGECTAACLAGVLSLEDALALVAARGRLMEEMPAGAMLAVPLGEEEVRPLLGERLSLAAVNGPARCVVSGPADAVLELERALTARGTGCRRLAVTRAFHSELCEPLVEKFVAEVARVKLEAPRLPFLSNVTGRWITAEEATDPAYWGRQLRQTVRFADGLSELVAADFALLEVGPDRVLSSLARSHPGEKTDRVAVSSLPARGNGESEASSLLAALGELHAGGVEVDWSAFHAGQGRLRVSLPTYPFQRRRYWIEGARRAAAPAAGALEGGETVVAEPQAAAEAGSPRRQEILEDLKSIVVTLTGLERDAIDVHAKFLEVGIDSLLLIQATQLVEQRLGIKLSIVQLLEELTSLDLLAVYLERELPPPAGAIVEPRATAVSAPAPVPPSTDEVRQDSAPAAVELGSAAGGETLLERLLARQLQVMSEQLQLVRGLSAAAPPAPLRPTVEPPPRVRTATPLKTVSPSPDGGGGSTVEPETFVPYQPIPSDLGELTDRQRRHLEAFVGRYTARTSESRRLSERYRAVYADGRVTARFRRLWKDLVYPLTGRRSAGSRVWDVDGNEYVDVVMGYGVHLFGHSPDFLTEALGEELRRGIELAPRGHLAGAAAELICELTGMDRAAFCNSGTEAVMAALRAARTVTRRERVALFAGAYHGWSAGTLARALSADLGARPVPVAPVVSAAAAGDVLVLPYGRPESLEILRARAGELAAVLVEPVQSRRPDIQPVDFLRELRALTEEAGTVLIFDEMVTGFRVHPGGVQARWGIRADLATYGKVVGGGMPIGVVAGRARFMDVFDGGPWRFGDDSYPTAVKTLFGGAFFANPLTMAAACAVLERIKNEGPALQERIERLTADLAARLNALFAAGELPLRVGHFGSLFRFLHPGRLKHADLLFYHLVEKGVYFAPEVGNCFLSTAHTAADVDAIERAVAASVEELRDGGFLPEGPEPRRRTRSRAVVSAPAATPAPVAAPVPGTEPAVEFSLYYFGQYEPEYRRDKYDLLFHGVRFADQRGFRAVWLPERHFHSFGGFSPNPAVLAAALARETERIEIRAGSVVLPLHHPIRVAEEWALLDNLSDGRVGVSFASGWHPNDFALAPEAYADRHEIMLRGIETVRRLWRGESLAVRSGTGQPLSVRLFPLPKRAELPIWLTGTSPETYRRAGRLGAGVVTNLQDQTVEEVAQKVRLYREALAEAGHDRAIARVTVLLHTFLDADPAAARERARRPFCSYLRSNLGLLRNRLASEGREVDLERLAATDLEYLLNEHYERWAAGSTLIGSPESVAEVVARLAAAGVTEVGCLVDFGVEADLVLASLHQVDTLRQRFARVQPAALEPSPHRSVVSAHAIPEPAGAPLTAAQQALWFLTQLGPDASRAYNESMRLDLRGALRPEALAGALTAVVARHEALCARFSPDGEWQWIAPAAAVPMPLVDLSALEGAGRAREGERLTLAWAQEPLDLERGPLLRAALLRLAAEEHRLTVTTHHLVLDGHSAGVVVRELAALYTAACRGGMPALPRPGRFTEVARRLADADPAVTAAAERYWAERFAEPATPLALPLDRPRPPVKRYDVARHQRPLGDDLAAALRSFGRQQGSTLFMSMLAGFKIFLHQVTGQRDLIVGINAAPTSGESERALVGDRVSGLPLRSRIAAGQTVRAYLAQVKRLVVEGYEHQGFSPGRLLRQLKLKRDPSRPHVAAVVFDLEHSGAPPEFAGLQVEIDANPVGAKVDLYVRVLESAGGIAVRCDYDACLFAPATIARWLQHYEQLLRAIVAAPDGAIDELPRPLLPAPPRAAPASNLTHYQRLLWASQKLAPGAPLLANAGITRLRACIVPQLLARALQSVVDGSDALRTTIEEVHEEPVQKVGEPFACAMGYQDLSGRPDPAAEARDLALARCRVPHELAQSLVDVALYKLGEDDFLWYLNLNHLVADAWAVTVVLRAVFDAYQELLAGVEPAVVPLPLFADFVEREREALASPDARRAEEHWREKLSREAEEMSFYGAAPARLSGRLERLTMDLGAERSARLKAIAAREPFYLMSPDLSLFSLLGSLVCAYLARISGNRTLSLGMPFHNRTTEAAKRTVGLLMQILPLRVALDPGETFPSLAEKLALENLESLRFRGFPVGNPLRRRAYDVEFNYMPMSFPAFAGRPLEFEWFQAGHGADSLAVQIFDIAGRESLLAQLDFHCDVFDERQRQLAAAHLLLVVDAFLADPGRQIVSFPLLSGDERRQVVHGFNATAREFPLGQGFAEAFQAQVERDPERIAVADDAGVFTYAELHEHVCRLALRLETVGVGPESLVAVLAPRGRGFLAAVLAIYRAGGAYLPLDPAHPAGRLRQLLRQSGVAVALAAPELHPALLGALDGMAADERPLVLELEDAGSDAVVVVHPPLPGPAALAYVIYTSGSTGAPKGAMVEQAGMMNHLFAKVADLALGFGDVVAQSASQCFDISVWQLLAPLLVGGRVRVFPDEIVRDPLRLLARVEEEGITVLETVPSLLNALLDELEAAGADRPRLQALRWLLATGEALPADSCRRWLDLYPEVPLVNAFGPTECSDDVTHHVLRRAVAGAVPIGRPIANLRAYVVDREGFPVPAGVAGELWIGGAGVGRGYLHDPQSTAAAFVPDDFSGEAGGRLYRTGDLARFRPDGCLDFLGRIDDQVKVRGHRIEPGEIEAALRGHPEVRECAVLARREDGVDPALVAYLVPRADAGPQPAELRAYLGERLPDAMVPAHFVRLDALPRTPNGKLDRAALPPPESGRAALAQSAVAPRDRREAALAAIWKDVLGIAEVGVHDNFFELGGDSILSIQVASRAGRVGLRFSPVQLFEHPTIARLAAAAEAGAGLRGEQGIVTGSFPLTPIQRRFFELDLPNPHHWNQSLLLEVARPLAIPCLAAALSHLLAHHDALRLCFHPRAAGWKQELGAPGPTVPLSCLDLSALPEEARSGAIEGAAAALQGSLHLSAGPLLRLAWFHCGGAPGRLLLVAHHLVVDGVSWRVLLEDLDAAYRQLERGGPVELPPKTSSFKAWGERLVELARSPALREERAYWLAESRSRVRLLPRDFAGGVNTRASARGVSVALDAEETRALLRDVPGAFQTQINDVLLAALAEVFIDWTGGGPLLVDLEGHGREEIAADLDLSRTVGWFTSLFPVLLDVAGRGAPAARLAAVREQLRAVPRNGIGYGVLRYCGDADTAGRLRALPAAEVSFNYLGRLDQALPAQSPFRLARESAGPAAGRGGMRSHVLEINGLVVAGRLRLEWAYSENLHRAETVAMLAGRHTQALRALIAASRGEPTAASGPSDFNWSPKQLEGIAAILEQPRGKQRRAVQR